MADYFTKDTFEEAHHYLENFTYFWTSTIVVPEAARFDFRKIVAGLARASNVTVTINNKHYLVFTIDIHKLTAGFHPDNHFETVANALQVITEALMNAYIGKLELG